MRHPSLSFALAPSAPRFGPRVGQITLIRACEDARSPLDISADTAITMDTPNILVGTTRGVVPHLSCDHTSASDAIHWINVPFESFLEQAPPIPTLQRGPHPLHRCLGLDPRRHIASLCLRDPLDTRAMPPNGPAHVAASCVRGVKKVAPSDWRAYVHATRPDVVFALADTPFTPLPVSQKRTTKSIERGVAWVADVLRPVQLGDGEAGTSPSSGLLRYPLNVLVPMAGGTSLAARAAFAHALLETLHGPDAEAVRPLRCLDEGIAGYVFDLAVLRGVQPSPNTSLHHTVPDGFLRRAHPAPAPHDRPEAEPDMAPLLKASLERLPERKPRLVTGTWSPHEMLHLIRDVGVDLFDVGWAVHAAHVGVALDFVFPVPTAAAVSVRRGLGHNLYDPAYARQFGRLADALVGAAERAAEGGAGDGDGGAGARPLCPCIACSPRVPSVHIRHSTVDEQSYAAAAEGQYARPYSRAYVHHLLHTHEMSAHTFLVAHNLAVMSAFLAGVRRVWVESGDAAGFALEAERFDSAYDDGRALFDAAKKDWEYVDQARGKGRLAREREKQARGQDEGERI